MTNGTAQGLYVIVAVVIFGIFVGISSLIFQDSLRPKLASIFCNAFTQVGEQTGFSTGVCGMDKDSSLDGFYNLDSKISFGDNSVISFNDVDYKAYSYFKLTTNNFNDDEYSPLSAFVEIHTYVPDFSSYDNPKIYIKEFKNILGTDYDQDSLSRIDIDEMSQDSFDTGKFEWTSPKKQEIIDVLSLGIDNKSLNVLDDGHETNPPMVRNLDFLNALTYKGAISTDEHFNKNDLDVITDSSFTYYVIPNNSNQFLTVNYKGVRHSLPITYRIVFDVGRLE